MNLILTNDEEVLLARILKTDLGDMKAETGKTENYNWRVEMKADEERLRHIIERLEQGAAAA